MTIVFCSRGNVDKGMTHSSTTIIIVAHIVLNDSCGEIKMFIVMPNICQNMFLATKSSKETKGVLPAAAREK
jgi:hypothetical protein